MENLVVLYSLMAFLAAQDVNRRFTIQNVESGLYMTLASPQGLISPVIQFEKGLLSPQGDRLKVPHMGWNEVRHES